MKNIKSFTKDKYIEGKKIIIYGAGNYGSIAKAALKSIGLNVDLFVDRALGGNEYEGIKCINPIELSKYIEDIIIIASLNYFYDMLANCESIGMEYVYDMEELMSVNIDESQLSEYAIDELHNPDKYRNVVENYNGESFVVNHIELVITERCTLKCKDCANLMQYYCNPEDMDIDLLIKQFDSLLDCIDVLLDLRILGGEPFIIKDIGHLIRHYCRNNKVKRITVYTNSTIIPNEDVLFALDNPKVAVHMSNYGISSRNIDRLDEIFNEKGIQHYIHKYEKWNDLGNCEKRDFGSEKAKKMFAECIMARCITFYRGKLFLCPRAAHGERLGFFRNSKKDYVDFSKKIDDILAFRKEINDFISKSELTTACFYCNGSNNRSELIDAAVQMNRNNV